MSEFTAAVLVRPRFEQEIADDPRIEELTHDHGELNANWRYLLLVDPFLVEPSTVDILADLSEQMPLLYYFHSEDHGWGYRIFSGGREIAHLIADYDNNTLDSAHANPAAFAVFDIPQETVVRIASLLEPAGDEGPVDYTQLAKMREEFADLLEIEELQWMI